MDVTRETVKFILRILLAAFLVFAGICHLYIPEFFFPMMPSYLPWHFELIVVSGVFEVTLALLLLVPRYRALAGFGIILLLVAVFPANIHMALHPEVFPSVSQTLRWGRLPFQAFFMLWAWWVSK